MKSFKKIKLLSIIFMFIVIFSSCCSNIYADLNTSLDVIADTVQIDNASLDLTTFIYDKNGNEMITLHGTENRIPVSYNDLPDNLVNAVISIEDERFFSHHGIDIKRTIAAAFTYITNGGSSSFGGSTITQQLIKNISNDNENSIARKIREWIRAIDIEKKLSKEDIFEAYINTIYMGEGSYGIEIAAQNYFSKSVQELNLAECACLAATIQSPEGTNPYRSEEAKSKLLARQKVVLQKMLELGKISQRDYEIALETPIEFKKAKSEMEIQSYYVDAVIEEFAKYLQQEENLTYEQAINKIYTGGYKIYTCFDPEVQSAIDSAYSKYSSSIFYTNYDGTKMQSAMVVLDHTTGDVLGLIGGVDTKDANLVLNRATQTRRQPGSCMKPFGAYGPAFESGALTSQYDILQDAPLENSPNYNPQNYYGFFYGNVTVKYALAQSMNLPAVRANMKVDTNFAYNFAQSCR